MFWGLKTEHRALGIPADCTPADVGDVVGRPEHLAAEFANLLGRAVAIGNGKVGEPVRRDIVHLRRPRHHAPTWVVPVLKIVYELSALTA